MDEYSEFQKKTQYEKFDLKYMALGLCGEVGEVANEIKKLERDDKNILTKERKNKIILELGDTMWYFTGICNSLGISLKEVMKKNMEKLKAFNDGTIPVSISKKIT